MDFLMTLARLCLQRSFLPWHPYPIKTLQRHFLEQGMNFEMTAWLCSMVKINDKSLKKTELKNNPKILIYKDS